MNAQKELGFASGAVPVLRFARATETSGLRIVKVTESVVSVTGPVFFFGRDVEVLMGTSDTTLLYAVDSLPRWWKVECFGAYAYRLKFNRPGAIALLQGKIDDASTLPVADNTLSIACSLPLTISTLDAGGPSGGVFTNNQAYWQGSNIVGIPGGLIGTFEKLKSVQLLAGYTSAVPVTPEQPVYVTLRFGPAGGGTNYMTPFFLGVQSAELPDATEGGVKMGDIVSFANNAGNEFTICFVIDYNVSEVGFWVPSAELFTGGVNAYCGARVAVWGLDNARATPSGGGATGPGIGYGGGMGGSPGGGGSLGSLGGSSVVVI